MSTARITELQGLLQTKVNDINGLSSAWKVETDTKGNPGIIMSTDQANAYRTAVRDAEEIKSLIETERKAAGLAEYLSAPADVPVAQRDMQAEYAARSQRKSLSQAFLGSDEAKSIAAQVKQGGRPSGSWRSEGVEVKDVWTAAGGTSTVYGLGEAQHLDIVPRPVRPTRVRDLFPHETTSANVLYGVRETGFVNNAAQVAQRDANGWVTAPTSDINLITVTYPVAEVAHLMNVHKNVLADEPRLRGILDRDMVDGIKLAEDFKILYGQGVGEDITGIFNTSGVQTYTQGSEKASVAIRKAATRAALAYYTPSGVVLHPYDWEGIEIEEDSQGAFRVAVSVAIGAEQRLWKMDVVSTPAIQQKAALVGSFGLGAKIYDREEVSVSVSSENGTNFEKGVVTLRASERLALEIPRPESFVLTTLS
jgi:HK97 family phage major capsid protein